MQSIKNLIEKNKLEEAKEQIILIENKLSEENNSYSQRLLITQINELKNLYIIKKRGNDKLEADKKKELEIRIDLKSTEEDDILDKIHISDKKDEVFDKIECKEIKIENCRNIFTKEITCEQTFLAINVIDSVIYCNASQVRLIGCRNIELHPFSKTGVFLQDSKEIKIIGKNQNNNNFKSVFDFNCPFGSVNYTIEEEN